MGNFGHDLRKLFRDLKRPKVILVVAAYGVFALAVILATRLLVPAFDLPESLVTFITAAALLGYPVATVLAWSSDIVPYGDDGRAAAAASPAGDSPVRVSRNGLRLVVAIGILVLASVAWMQYRSENALPPARPALAYIDSVAVMPLDNLTGNPNYDHIGIGITEEIITHLARIPPLKVISRHSVDAVSGQNLTVPQLANALGVRHIIEGSVRLDGDGLRITLQHINAETDAHIWAESFRASTDDVFALQEQVARQVSSRIVTMIPGLPLQSEESQADLGPGQKAYLQGEAWLSQRTAEGVAKAVDKFTEAIELDPGYAPAYANLSSAYALALFYRYDLEMDAYTIAARSLAMAEKALEIDPNLAAGHAARGYLGALIGQPAAAVAADFDRAAELQPNAASIPSWRARSLAQMGEFDKALSEAGRAIDLDPLAPGRHIALAELSLQLGHYDDAIASAKLATALEPRQIRSRAIEARALLLSGRAESCASLSLGPHKVLRATCLYAMGNEAEGRAIVSKTLANLRSVPMVQPEAGYSAVVTYEDLAIDYAWRGDAQKALEWAALAYGKSPVGLEIRVLESALFDAVRDDPQFAQTIQQIRDSIFDRVRRDSEQYR